MIGVYHMSPIYIERERDAVTSNTSHSYQRAWSHGKCPATERMRYDDKIIDVVSGA